MNTPPLIASVPAWGEVLDTLLLRASATSTTVVLGTALLGFAAGVIGVFALLRKRALVCDALSHATLPGLCIAFIVGSALGVNGMSMPLLLAGAACTGVLAVLAINAILRHTRLREDAAIGIVLSVFFAAGVVGLSYAQDPNNVSSSAAGLGHFIFGQAAAMRRHEVWMMGGLAITSVLAALLLLKEFAMVCFNDAFARVTGWRVGLIDLMMMALVVLVTVAGLQAVGLVLVIAMLIIPPVAARFWTERLPVLIALAGALGALGGYIGAVLSSLVENQPAGAVIVLTSGGVFLISMLLAPTRGVFAVLRRRWALRLRIAREHLLELACERGTAGSLTQADIQRVAQLRGWSGFTARIVLLSLRSRKEITRTGTTIALTPSGAARGERVRRNHALWERYLVRYADVAPSHVDWSVDQVEHVLSDELIAELETELASVTAGAP